MQTILVPLKNDKAVTVYSTDDVEPILEHNKALRGIGQKSDWGRHVASIPNIISVKWINEEYQRGNTNIRFLSKEWDALVARKLRDPEWAFLRTDAPSHTLGWGKK